MTTSAPTISLTLPADMPVLPDDNVVIWTPDARQTYDAMRRHVEILGAYYGVDSKQAREASESFLRVAGHLMSFPRLRVCKDGDLGLFGNAGFIVFGVVFHAVRRRCTVAGCDRYAFDDGHVYSYSGTRQVSLCKHQWAYPLHFPAPGTWSFHS